MLVNTQGIVLNHILFGDNDLIVKVLTKEVGLMSFLVKRGRKNKIKKFLQPLMIVSMSFNYRKNKNFQYIKELELDYVPNNILVNYKKRNTVLFLCEIITRSITEGLEDLDLYNFICKNLNWLNAPSSSVSYFDIWFLVHFTKVLGVSPNYSEVKELDSFKFNPSTGSFFVSTLRQIDGEWNKNLSKVLYAFLHTNVEGLNNFSLSYDTYKTLLDKVLNYYSIHVCELNYQNSVKVYKELL